ncbi:MAG: VanW family protein [Clostridia bacterium]|nr:VanW family protein [Clostridia bacterium]
MKKVFATTAVVFLLIALTAAGHSCSLYNKSHPGIVILDNLTPEGITNPLLFTNVFHPYSRPVEGALLWEGDEDFRNACSQMETASRMAAFKTSLPDPLPGEEYNIALAAEILAGTIVEPGAILSMNQTIGPYSRDRGFGEGPAYHGTRVVTTTGGGVCKIATTLYNTAVLADLEIIERRAHGMLVPYVPPGQDATVSYGVKDLKFRNNTESPILIWAQARENILYMAFYGEKVTKEISWNREILNLQNTYTIYRPSRELLPGEERVIIPGADGLTVRSWITILHDDGKREIQDLGVDYYRPMPRVVEQGV